MATFSFSGEIRAKDFSALPNIKADDEIEFTVRAKVGSVDKNSGSEALTLEGGTYPTLTVVDTNKDGYYFSKVVDANGKIHFVAEGAVESTVKAESAAYLADNPFEGVVELKEVKVKDSRGLLVPAKNA